MYHRIPTAKPIPNAKARRSKRKGTTRVTARSRWRALIMNEIALIKKMASEAALARSRSG
jgi:hypothetical protein